MPFNVIGIGEILWDRLPGGKMLGGAPANFAYVANALGNRGIVVSQVGRDRDGVELMLKIMSLKVRTEILQTGEKPTGTVEVSMRNDQPQYEIVENAAWDFLELTDKRRELAAAADAVCFGSLAQRHEVSRRAIREFVGLSKKLRIFDVNLRPPFFDDEILRASFGLANVVKLNHEELPVVAQLLGTEARDPFDAAKGLLLKFDLKMICVTRGAAGSFLMTGSEISERAGLKIEVKDPIGAGDAFTAALAHGLLRGWSLARTNEFADRVGAFVASQTGAMPEFPGDF